MRLINNVEYKGESVLPILFIILPNNKKLYESGLYDNLYENQQTFVTAYDIHDTYIHLAYSDFNDISTKKMVLFIKKKIIIHQEVNLFLMLLVKKKDIVMLMIIILLINHHVNVYYGKLIL